MDLGDLMVFASSTPADRRVLDDASLLTAVRVLRLAGEGNLLAAARESRDSVFPTPAEERARRYGVTAAQIGTVQSAVGVVRHRGLDEGEIAAFSHADYPDGTVIIICAAGLSRGEIAAIVQGHPAPPVSRLTTLAALRYDRIPAPDAMGQPIDMSHKKQAIEELGWPEAQHRPKATLRLADYRKSSP